MGRHSAKSVLLVFLVAAGCYLLSQAARKDRINWDSYQLIEKGMTRQEVEAILGVPPGDYIHPPLEVQGPPVSVFEVRQHCSQAFRDANTQLYGTKKLAPSFIERRRGTRWYGKQAWTMFTDSDSPVRWGLLIEVWFDEHGTVRSKDHRAVRYSEESLRHRLRRYVEDWTDEMLSRLP